MSRPSQFDTEVLIVGAGPVGLSMALELTRYGVPFRIIDKKAGTTQTSNAGGVHARTLELLDKDVAAELIKLGRPVSKVIMHAKMKKLFEIDISFLHTPFPYVLLIPQSHTEQVFSQALLKKGVAIEWNKTLQKFDQDQEKVTAEITTALGTEKITARWLIGCDGYHSAVRASTNIAYEGKDFLLRFIMIDALLNMKERENSFGAYFNDITLLVVPFLHSTRLIAEISHTSDKRYKEDILPDEKIFTEILKEFFPQPFVIEKVLWASRFYIHERLAKHYREQRVFLAGDAAHTHSPAGGQGMNTGIQDTMNLAWKLAMVTQGRAEMKLLDTYEEERRPIAEQVLAMTKAQTRLFLMFKNPWVVAIRNFLLPRLLAIKALKNKFAMMVSELAVHYRKGALYPVTKKKGSLAVGDRMPNIEINQQKLFDLMTRELPILLTFRDEKFSFPLRVIKIDQLPAVSRQVLGFSSDKGYCLIRPDYYVAYVGEERSAIENYFSSLRETE
jgi:2-polyprenyl-6-methoxyphenol hydroxylase-like FAD-dependent oxidoreductase